MTIIIIIIIIMYTISIVLEHRERLAPCPARLAGAHRRAAGDDVRRDA